MDSIGGAELRAMETKEGRWSERIKVKNPKLGPFRPKPYNLGLNSKFCNKLDHIEKG